MFNIYSNIMVQITLLDFVLAVMQHLSRCSQLSLVRPLSCLARVSNILQWRVWKTMPLLAVCGTGLVQDCDHSMLKFCISFSGLQVKTSKYILHLISKHMEFLHLLLTLFGSNCCSQRDTHSSSLDHGSRDK